jgi:lysophospholipase L1-like esterase
VKIILLFCMVCFAAQAPAATTFQKILFLGNSITKHGPKADIDWTGNWGMAASAERKDYVHLVTGALSEKQGANPEVLVQNIADFERSYADYDIAGKLKDALAFKADLVIFAIGENTTALKSPEDMARFQASITSLLRAFKADNQPTILVRSCFWANAAKDNALQKACEDIHGLYVDMSALSKIEANFARSERSFKHAGVANHPGDQGMAAIADAILEALLKS